MAKRRKHGYGNTPDPFRSLDNMSHYGGLRDTHRTRSAVRSAAARSAETRSPLDAIGGRFFTPDLSAWSTPIGGSVFTDIRPAAAREIARAAAPATVLPSKRRAKEAVFRAPDPLAKGRKASEFALRPTKTAIRELLKRPSLASKAPSRRSEGLSKRIGAVVSKLPSGLLSEVKKTLTSVRTKRTPTELAATSPRKSETVVRGAVHVRPDPLHAKRSPSVRDGKSSTTCKPRPEDNHPKRGGNGNHSREFIPWCEPERKRRR